MSKNEITGDRLVSRANSKAFDENIEKIFPPKRKCVNCEGFGEVFRSAGDISPAVCPVCNGSGKVQR